MDLEEEQHQTDLALQRALFDEALPSLGLGVVTALISIAYLFDRVPHSALAVWSIAVCVVLLLRLALILQVRRRSAQSPRPVKAYSVLTGMTGVLWGSLAMLWSAELALPDQIIILLSPVIASMGVIVSYGSWPRSYQSFVVGMAGAMLLAMSVRADASFVRLLLPMLFIVAACLYLSHRYYLQLRETIVLRLRTQKALQSKDEFLARMSHEMRTPMNGVLGMARLLAKSPLNEEQHQQVTTLIYSGENMLGLVSDLLDAASLAGNDVALSIDSCDVRKLLDDLLSTYKDRIDGDSIVLLGHVDENVPAFLRADAFRLSQLLSKLVDNAVKFTEQGEIVVSLSQSDTQLQMIVRDSGCGISPAELQLVRTLFHQVDGHSRRRAGGTGLGLTIAQALADLMNGRLEISSEPGRGTVVTVSLPMAAAEEVVVSNDGSMLTPLSVSAAEVHTSARIGAVSPDDEDNSLSDSLRNQLSQNLIRALVAEDNPVNQLVIESVLEQLGCATTLVENGQEALLALQADSYDIVFMDCQMPELDGFEATRQARKKGYALPIVAVTANTLSGDRERCLAAGMDDYVAKPFTDDTLEEMLRKWLGSRQARGVASPA